MKKLLLFAVLFLLGCATAETPAQKVFAATSTYDAALPAAVAYRNLPPCGEPKSPKLCSDRLVIRTILNADTLTFEAIQSAQSVVRNPDSSKTALETAATWAKEAAAAFGRIAASLKK